MNAQPEFEPCEPSRWFGRYARIPGDSSVFHIKHVNGRMWPTILWQRESGTGTCPAFDGEATRGIVDAVMDAKIKAGGSGGGSFIINEYGQVLVPASDGSGRRYIVGELKGRWLFENPFDENEPIDLGDSKGLGIGDPWDRPYVGFPFNLSARDKVYFNQEDEEGRRSIYPDLQDFTLMLALRSARSSGGPIRFIVNPFGVVLTKRKVQDPPEERWQPVYVGKVIFGQWFDKEN